MSLHIVQFVGGPKNDERMSVPDLVNYIYVDQIKPVTLLYNSGPVPYQQKKRHSYRKGMTVGEVTFYHLEPGYEQDIT